MSDARDSVISGQISHKRPAGRKDTGKLPILLCDSPFLHTQLRCSVTDTPEYPTDISEKNKKTRVFVSQATARASDSAKISAKLGQGLRRQPPRTMCSSPVGSSSKVCKPTPSGRCCVVHLWVCEAAAAVAPGLVGCTPYIYVVWMVAAWWRRSKDVIYIYTAEHCLIRFRTVPEFCAQRCVAVGTLLPWYQCTVGENTRYRNNAKCNKSG